LPEEVGGVKANCEIPKVLPSQKVFLLEMNGSGNIKRSSVYGNCLPKRHKKIIYGVISYE